MKANKAEKIINEIIDKFCEQMRPMFLKVLLEEEKINYIVKHNRKNGTDPDDILIDSYLDYIIESGSFAQKADREIQNIFNNIKSEISKHLRSRRIKIGISNVIGSASSFSVFFSYIFIFVAYIINKDAFPDYVSGLLNWGIGMFAVYGLLSIVITPIAKYILEDKEK